MMKFIITGGHHNSALVVARHLQILGASITWVGRKFAIPGDANVSAEFTEVTNSNIPFINLQAGKIGTRPSLSNFTKIPAGFIHAFSILAKNRPDAVITFGSYLGLTTALAAGLQGIPVFVHEQTVVAGKANKIAGKFARKIYLTWPSSQKFYSKEKSLLVGLPLRDSILKSAKKKLFSNDLPTILILGGKQGSHFINNAIFANLDKLLKHYNIIHQTGTSSITGSYQRAIKTKKALRADLQSRYQPHGYISESKIGTYLHNCDLVISRSGAHITYELALIQVPAILIPFLHTHNREQLRNAKMLESSGQASILFQTDFTHELLSAKINYLLTRKSPPKKLNLPTNAADVMTKDIITTLGN